MEKLKNGDFCENLTKEQFDELIEIEDYQPRILRFTPPCNLIYDETFGLCHLINDVEKLNKLSFEDFKQRCINTLKKISHDRRKSEKPDWEESTRV